eukprot:GHVR01132127.1.p1 GENE.GHVR01132127.1~~GHVR01132127.1.p1  ORF type:complete len:506 (-),score=137.97 GHVR01132127.1:865-2382(-)
MIGYDRDNPGCLDDLEEAAAKVANDQIDRDIGKVSEEENNNNMTQGRHYSDDDNNNINNKNNNNNNIDENDKKDIKPIPQDGVPSDVIEFLKNFYFFSIQTKQKAKLEGLFEKQFPDLSSKYYKNSRWPSPDIVRELFQEHVSNINKSSQEEMNKEETARKDGKEVHHPPTDERPEEPVVEELAVVLYKELYYRHAYGRVGSPGITWNDRLESWNNYNILLQYMIEYELPKDQGHIIFPVSWLWDMLYEFVYQFQSFHQWRCKVVRLLFQEQNDTTTTTKANDEGHIPFRCRPKKGVTLVELYSPEVEGVWSVEGVEGLLNEIEKASDVANKFILWKDNNINSIRSTPSQDTYKKGGVEDVDDKSELLGHYEDQRVALGFFAVVCKMRLYTILGKYEKAIESIDAIDIHSFQWYTQSCRNSCHVNLSYTLGLCYFALKRYQDSISTLQTYLIVFQKVNKRFGFNIQFTEGTSKMVPVLRILHLIMLFHTLFPNYRLYYFYFNVFI